MPILEQVTDKRDDVNLRKLSNCVEVGLEISVLKCICVCGVSVEMGMKSEVLPGRIGGLDRI